MTLLDPYAVRPEYSPVRFLYRLNPLTKLLAPLPAMMFVVFTRDVATPLSLLVFSYILLFIGAHLTRRTVILMLLGVPLAVCGLSLCFGAWADHAQVADTAVLFQLGNYRFAEGSWEMGLTTALRLVCLMALALIAGLTTTGPELVRSLVQQLRVPYRIGYTALAAFRFVPRFGYELKLIRSAHRVRGMSYGRGPVAWVRRWLGYVVPLLAGAIRHAERVALAMDARAFGASTQRTERYPSLFRARDVLFIVMFWFVSAALYLVVQPTELTLR